MFRSVTWSKVRGLEIAAYRSAIAVARVLGEDECAQILQESLKEEEAMATFLEQNAPRALRKLQSAMG